MPNAVALGTQSLWLDTKKAAGKNIFARQQQNYLPYANYRYGLIAETIFSKALTAKSAIKTAAIATISVAISVISTGLSSAHKRAEFHKLFGA